MNEEKKLNDETVEGVAGGKHRGPTEFRALPMGASNEETLVWFCKEVFYKDFCVDCRKYGTSQCSYGGPDGAYEAGLHKNPHCPEFAP